MGGEDECREPQVGEHPGCWSHKAFVGAYDGQDQCRQIGESVDAGLEVLLVALDQLVTRTSETYNSDPVDEMGVVAVVGDEVCGNAENND